MVTDPNSNAATARVLVVDDDPGMRQMVERFLARLGHRSDTASSVDDAIRYLAEESYDLVVTDLHMPGASGLDLLAQVRTEHPDTRMILMSGQAETHHAAEAIRRGVDHLLLKPFRFEDLRAGVEKALAERRAQVKVAADREKIEELLRQGEADSRKWILRSARALTTAVEAKDAYTAGHASRVTAYALVIAETMGGIEVDRFRLAGDLHDVGKIGVPDSVLNKPGRPTDEEFQLIRKHPEVGERILGMLIDDPLVLGVVRSHHERWDGRGYPDGLGADDIPLPARILAAADTLDAMTSSRAYRFALSWDVAVSEVRRCAGSQFDPRVVDAFNQALPELDALFRETATAHHVEHLLVPSDTSSPQ